MPKQNKITQDNKDARLQRAERLRDMRRSMITDAARRVFSSAGLDGASMRSIAREAGCTTGAIYPYFQNKEELYAAVLEASLQELHAHVVETTAEKTAEGRELTSPQAGVLAFYDFYLTRPDDLALGLYLFNGLKPVGLGRQLDTELNLQIAETVRHIESCAQVAYAEKAQSWTAAAIAQCIGLLVMEHTGRIGYWDWDGRSLLVQFLKSTSL